LTKGYTQGVDFTVFTQPGENPSPLGGRPADNYCLSAASFSNWEKPRKSTLYTQGVGCEGFHQLVEDPTVGGGAHKVLIFAVLTNRLRTKRSVVGLRYPTR
jgi:hypothetical protein